MKRLIITLFICFTGQILLAQNSKTAPVMTAAFSDSLKHQITQIMPPELSVTKLLYTSSISAEGKLTKPLIARQFGGGSIADNDFVVKLRLLIIAAPAWKPAFDNTLNKAVEDSVLFTIEIAKDKIKIKQGD